MLFALIQQNFTVGDFAGNAEKIFLHISQIKEKVDLCITSELALWGYPPRDLLLSAKLFQESQRVFDSLVQKISKYPPCLIGFVEKEQHNDYTVLYNSVALCINGKVVQIFRKCLLPNYDIFDEKRYFNNADQCGFFELDNKKIGVTICEDLWCHKHNHQQQHLKNLKKQQLDFIINISSSPYTNEKEQQREKIFKNISRMFTCPLIFVNQIGGNDNIIFDGGSTVYHENDIIFKMKSFQEDIGLYNSNVKKPLQFSSSHWEESIFNTLLLGIQDYFKKTKNNKAVVGVSGGIDSALTLYLATRALGAKNVYGYFMPSIYTSVSSKNDAFQLAHNLNIQLQEINISPLIKSYLTIIHQLFPSYKEGVTEENIQARIRGTLLMACANKLNALLLTTGNKSELACGYCTLYGDMCGALSVIGDLTKTMVYQLCHWINTQETIFSETLLTKEPTAELRFNQKDSDTLPNYAVLDTALNSWLNETSHLQGIEDENTKKQLFSLFHQSEFKRKQAAPVLKVTEKGFDNGWRTPIVHKPFLHNQK